MTKHLTKLENLNSQNNTSIIYICCDICNKVRQDRKINTINRTGMIGGWTHSVNIRACNDNKKCPKIAEEKAGKVLGAIKNKVRAKENEKTT